MAASTKTTATLKRIDVSAKLMLHLQNKIIIYVLKTEVEDSSEKLVDFSQNTSCQILGVKLPSSFMVFDITRAVKSTWILEIFSKAVK